MVLKVQINKTAEELAGKELPTGDVDSLGTELTGELSDDGRFSGPTNASSIVNEDKKAKGEGARNTAPAKLESSEDDLQKKIITDKDSIVNLNKLTDTNGRLKPTSPVVKAVGTDADSTVGESVGVTSDFISNKDGDDDIDKDSFDPKQVQADIPEEYLEAIQTKENPFKGFATMTYSISVYLLGKSEYNSMVSTGRKSVNGLTLLLQSGGISKDPKNNYGAKRSQYFSEDFYIDDVELKGLISGTSVGSAHNVFEMGFTITEPNGISFLDRLHAAVQEYNIKTKLSKKRVNYASQNFLMVLRFYGYDKNGNMISGKDIGITETFSDAQSVNEKFIPFQFTNIQFGIQNDVVRYRCQAVAPQTQIPYGLANSTIDFNVELTGQTVASVLSGLDLEKINTSEEVTTTEELEAQDEILEQTIDFSLMEALNAEQSRLLNSKQVEHKHKYKIEFEENSGIGDASVLSLGDLKDKSKSPMTNKSQSHKALLENKGFYDSKKQRFNISAGQSIVQAIDLIIRTSTYISNQQNFVIDEKTGKISKKVNTPKVLQWFKIRTQIKPLEYDNKRNDYAYEIKYIVSRYQINNLRSPYYGPSYFRGVHKKYNYWFTGENTEVLDFNQEYNYLYFQSFSDMTGITGLQNNARELTKQVYKNSSEETTQGGKNKRNEASANAASLLYSPADQASAELTILGDPDWIAQSEIFYSPEAVGIGQGPFMSDGSVNYDSSEVLFALNYNTIVDYDLKTGIQDVGNQNFGRNTGSGIQSNHRVSLIYRANEVTTKLDRGSFVQHIRGTLMLFPTQEQAEEQEELKKELIDKQLDPELQQINDDADELARELELDSIQEEIGVVDPNEVVNFNPTTDTVGTQEGKITAPRDE